LSGAATIEFEDVSFTYPGGLRPALERVSFTVDAGERLGILGPNGGGKSTLVKIALGLLPGYSGRVSVCGQTPDRARASGLIGYVPQRCEAVLEFPVSVRQVVEMGARAHRAGAKAVGGVSERVEECLGLVGAESFAASPVGAISGGQLQRALIARALAAAPRILALDEPTVGIDAVGQRQFGELLERLHERERLTILVVSHDLRVVAAGCDRVACLARTLHFHDHPRGLTSEVLAEVFEHDVAGVLCTDDHAHG